MYFTCGDFHCASAIVPFLPTISTARRHLVYCYFSFTTTATQGVISGNTISVRVPAATSLTNLVANFQTSNGTVLVGAAQQTTRVTANNFTGPVMYTLMGTNGATRSYTVTVTQTANDVFAPTISSVTATPAAVSTFPATIALRVNFNDVGTGYSYGSLYMCDGAGGLLSASSVTNMGSYLQGTVTVQNYHPSGTWRLCSVYLTDAAGNSGDYNRYNPYNAANYSMGSPGMDSGVAIGGVVSVTGTTPDTTAPVITSVTATPSSVSTFPATVTVRVNYTETGSGYSSGTFSLCSPTQVLNTGTGSRLYVYSTTNGGTYFQGTATLQNYHEAGTWKVCAVSIWDIAGNYNDYTLRHSASTTNYTLKDYTTVSNVPVGGAVTVSGTTSDTTAPVITSVTATPSSVSTYPATVTVRIYYTETGSGSVSGTFNLCSPTRLANTVGGISISSFGLTNAGAYMQGTVTLQNYHEAGTWKACNVSLWDAAGNMRSLEAYSFYSNTYYYSDSVVTNVPIGGAVVKN